MKPTQFQTLKFNFAESRRSLEQILARNLPGPLLEAAKQCKQFFDQYDLSVHAPQRRQLTGVNPTPETLLEIIREASGSTKWRLVNQQEEYGDELQISDFRDVFGIEYADSDVVRHMYHKEARSRDILCHVDITCLAGSFLVQYANDRASVGDDVLLNSVEELKKHIERIFENED